MKWITYNLFTHALRGKTMKASIKTAKSLIATTVLLGTLSTAMADNNGRDFRVCTPYDQAARTLNAQITNFDVEVLGPLERELAAHADASRYRANDESKLSSVVSKINSAIRNSEGRLSTNPRTIEDNKRRMVSARQEISSLDREIAKYTRELEDAGFIKKKVLKKKIKNRKKDIKKEEQKIVNLGQANVQLAEEIRTLPARIASLKGDLVVANANFNQLRNRIPTLAELRTTEAAARRRLDSQEDIEAGLRRELVIAERKFSRCLKIEENAHAYRILKKMVKLLKANDCNVEAVRNRLPYDVSRLELRVLEEANQMVCAPVVAPVGQ